MLCSWTVVQKGQEEMKSIRFLNLRVLIGILFIFGWVSLSLAQDRKVDINALVQETQKMSDRSGEMTLIWWIPEEFWQASFQQDPNMTAAQTEEFIKVLRPYMLIVAVDGNIGSFGGVPTNLRQLSEVIFRS